MKALGPSIPARCLRGVHKDETCRTIWGGALLIEVDGDIRNQRIPEVLEIVPGIVERPRGGVHDMAADAAVFTCNVRCLAPVEHIELADAALPPFYCNVARINSSGRGGGRTTAGDPTGTGRTSAVHGARKSQSGRKRETLLRVQYSLIGANVSVTHRSRTVNLPTSVVDGVHAGSAEPRGV